MIVKDLEDNEYEWAISTKVARGNRRKTSKLHATAKMLLHKKYPNVPIYEEVEILVEPKKRLYLDFYIPRLLLAIEVNGGQHYKFTSQFHTNMMGFYKALQNDKKKMEWCEINEIDLVVLKFDEIKQWDKQI